MMEFLVFKDGKDMDERKEEAIGVLQKGEENNLSIGPKNIFAV